MASLLMNAKERGRIQIYSSTAPSETFLHIHRAQASTILFETHTHGCHIKEMGITMSKQGFHIAGSAGGTGINQT